MSEGGARVWVRAPFFFLLAAMAAGLSGGAIAMGDGVSKSEEEWKHCLTPGEYKILREKGTEAPFSGKYWKNKEDGSYLCAGCGAELFSSETQFDSGTGWPSFWEPASEGRVTAEKDASHGMDRTEVVCSRCGGHLGHVFEDGPDPTGLRYCINSGALKFKEKP